MKRISQILSAVFSPFIIPTYGIILASGLSMLAVLPIRVLLMTVAITFVITCMLPFAGILALYKTGVVKTISLNNRNERHIPYVLAMLCYLGCAFFLHRAAAPAWLSLFYVGGALAIAVNTLVNVKWKISSHAAAMGGLVALLFRLAASHQAIYSMNVWLSCAVIVAGMVMTARIYLGHHTLLQVLAGAANGFLCVWLIWYLTLFIIYIF